MPTTIDLSVIGGDGVDLRSAAVLTLSGVQSARVHITRFLGVARDDVLHWHDPNPDYVANVTLVEGQTLLVPMSATLRSPDYSKRIWVEATPSQVPLTVLNQAMETGVPPTTADVAAAFIGTPSLPGNPTIMAPVPDSLRVKEHWKDPPGGLPIIAIPAQGGSLFIMAVDVAGNPLSIPGAVVTIKDTSRG